jgi:hypothetical protein
MLKFSIEIIREGLISIFFNLNFFTLVILPKVMERPVGEIKFHNCHMSENICFLGGVSGSNQFRNPMF